MGMDINTLYMLSVFVGLAGGVLCIMAYINNKNDFMAFQSGLWSAYGFINITLLGGQADKMVETNMSLPIIICFVLTLLNFVIYHYLKNVFNLWVTGWCWGITLMLFIYGGLS